MLRTAARLSAATLGSASSSPLGCRARQLRHAIRSGAAAAARWRNCAGKNRVSALHLEASHGPSSSGHVWPRGCTRSLKCPGTKLRCWGSTRVTQQRAENASIAAPARPNGRATPRGLCVLAAQRHTRPRIEARPRGTAHEARPKADTAGAARRRSCAWRPRAAPAAAPPQPVRPPRLAAGRTRVAVNRAGSTRGRPARCAPGRT
jgi:hypothetical protein